MPSFNEFSAPDPNSRSKILISFWRELHEGPSVYYEGLHLALCTDFGGGLRRVISAAIASAGSVFQSRQ